MDIVQNGPYRSRKRVCLLFRPAKDDIGRAVTLLHELGHAYDVIWGMGSSALANEEMAIDAKERTQISEKNTQLVREKCFN